MERVSIKNLNGKSMNKLQFEKFVIVFGLGFCEMNSRTGERNRLLFIVTSILKLLEKFTIIAIGLVVIVKLQAIKFIA